MKEMESGNEAVISAASEGWVLPLLYSAIVYQGEIGSSPGGIWEGGK